MTVIVRRLSVEDLPIAGVILDAAYGPGERAARLRRYLSLQPDGWFLGLLDGEAVGLGGALNYGACAYLGLMAVHPRAQRRGVARAVAERILGWLDGAGCPSVLLDASPMGAPLYASLGFAPDEESILFRRDPSRSLPEARAVLAPLERRDLPEVTAFDAPVFGALRPAVLASYCDDLAGRAWLLRNAEGVVEGYAFAQSAVIGPWAAIDAARAETLLTAAFAVAYHEPPTVMIPSTNIAGVALLERQGFSPVRALLHMRRGGARPPGRREQLFGRASFAIG